jgi:hypothetical protein
MNMDHAAMFLASSILTMLAAIVWVIAILIINNLVHKYWKPVGIYKIIDPNVRFAEPQELKKEHK